MNQRIYKYSLHLLARQDYSEYKLRKKLLSKVDNLPHEVDEVLSALKEKKLLKEDSYRRQFVRKWILRGESDDKIRRRGSQEKLTIELEDLASIRSEMGLEQQEGLESLIQKKLRSTQLPEDPNEKYKLRNKVLRFLLTKGHDFSSANKALSRYFHIRLDEDNY
jgi:regulatory protein